MEQDPSDVTHMLENSQLKTELGYKDVLLSNRAAVALKQWDHLQALYARFFQHLVREGQDGV
jgi:hypothetical protein